MIRCSAARSLAHSRRGWRSCRSIAEQSAVARRRLTNETRPRYGQIRVSRLTTAGYLVGLLTAVAISYKIGTTYSVSPVQAKGGPVNQQSTASTLPLATVPPSDYDLSDANLEGAFEELCDLLGEANVDRRYVVRRNHSSTEWSLAPDPDNDVPSMVVYPGSTQDVSDIARICHKRRIPMIGFSGGTSLEGTLAAQNREVCLDFKNMNQILQIRREDMDVTVQPAVGYEELNAVLAEHGMFFPPDPGPGAAIGGAVSQGCSGTNAYRYGPVRDWVLGLEVVLADGSVINTRARPRKSSSGYDLTRIFTGSEGTLGFITQAHIKVATRPQNIRVAVAQFKGIADAIKMAVRVVQDGQQLEAMELIDEVGMRAVNLGGYCSTEWSERPTLFMKLAGSSPSVVAELADSVQTLSESCNATMFRLATDAEEGAEIWQARKTILWSLIALKKDPQDLMLSADACVPISKVGEIIMKTKEQIDKSGLLSAFVGHVGDGNVHTFLSYSPDKAQEARRLITDTQRMSVDLDGTVSGEHGIGLEFRDEVIYELGEVTVDAMRAIKYALDPLFLLNPGKMIRVQNEKK